MIIRSYTEASHILKTPRYLSNRHGALFRRLRARSGASLKDLEDFFAEWPMYMDGQKHRDVRDCLMTAISATADVGLYSAIIFLKQAASRGVIDTLTLDALTKIWHRELFGMNDAQWVALNELCEPIMRFLLHREAGDNLHTIDAKVRDLLSWFQIQCFHEGRLIENMRVCGLSPSTVINIAIDSYEPVRSAIGIVFFLGTQASKSERSETSPSAFVQRCLAKLPPFRFINRRDSEIYSELDAKVTVDIQSCNSGAYKRWPPSSLSFGTGPHLCPGRSPSIRFLISAWEALEEILDKSSGMQVMGHIDGTASMHMIRDFSITFSNEQRREFGK